MKALICGAGIGGLTSALCLHKAGFEVQLLEQASALENVGAGIQLSPNACRVLNALGLLQPLTESSFEPSALEMRIGKSGRRVFSINAGQAAIARWGAPYLHVHRADLISCLKHALEDVAPQSIHYNSQLAAYQQTETTISATLADGARIDAEVLIGADGIHSAVRQTMHGQQPPRFTGNVAWRATAPIAALKAHPPPPSACVWVGDQRHAVTYRLRGGQLANIVGIVEQNQWRNESWTERGDKSDALADFAGWHPAVTTLLSQADTHYRWALYDRDPLPSWQDGRAVLLGDACHPMLPFLAQGAAMAIEDAWVLASALSQHDEVSAANQSYTSIRLPRTHKVQVAASSNMHTFHRANGLSQILFYGPMWLAGKLSPSLIESRMDWVYGVDVTAEYRIT